MLLPGAGWEAGGGVWVGAGDGVGVCAAADPASRRAAVLRTTVFMARTFAPQPMNGKALSA